jgi:hypothetical protein
MKRLKLFLKAFPMAGRIFYSPRFHQFVQVKCIYWNNAECGGFTNYYEDARTNILRQVLSYAFLADCILINAIDTFEFAEFRPDISAWKAK